MDYLPYYQLPDYGTNPWSDITQQSLSGFNSANNAYLTQTPQIQSNITNQQNNMNAFSQATQAYPTIPATPAPAPQMQQTNQSNSDPSATSRLFNPWSLTGEALSR